MQKLAIRVHNLGKRYCISEKARPDGNLRKGISAIEGPLTGSPAQQFHPKSTIRPAERDGNFIWALRNISFDVKEGEVIGVVGRNGAGKSTLLKILSRITEPTQGYAEVQGRVGSLLGIGTGFHSELTGRENIYLSGRVLGMRRLEIEKKLEGIAEFSEVGRYLDMPLKSYSFGMQARLGFAIACHLEPDVLLVDEVLSVGDLLFQRKCMDRIKNVAKEGRTVLFVSHSIGVVSELAGGCILLEAGRLVRKDSPDKIVDLYLRCGNSLILKRDLNLREPSAEPARKPLWKISHVEIVSPEKRVLSNQPLEISIGYRSFALLENIIVGVGISNLQGTRLISCSSADGGLRIHSKKDECGIVKMRIESPHLSPGIYVLELGASVGRHHTLDYVPEALRFEVHPNAQDAWALTRKNLGIRLPSTWEIEIGHTEKEHGKETKVEKC